MASRCRFVLALLTAVTLHAGPAHAQDRPVVFLHGINSDGGVWGAVADWLRGGLQIAPDLPTLTWRLSFEQQAGELNARPEVPSLPASTTLIGHSNGGIVAREWVRGRSAGGLITIGSPHRGAPILAHFVAWSALNGATPGWLDRVLDAFSIWSDWSYVLAYVNGAMHWVSDFSIWSVLNLSTSLGILDRAPVAFEMLPGSPYLQNLDSGINLSHEAFVVPNRVGIVSIAHNFYWAGPARAIAPDAADDIAVTMYGAAFGFLYWGGLINIQADPADVVATEQSMSLLGLAGQVLSIDPFYCRAVSDVDMSECRTSDGVVPTESQAYPGAPNLLIGTDNDGPAHIQEPGRADEAVYQALTQYTHVQLRGEPAPGPSPGPGPNPAPNPSPFSGPPELPPGQALAPNQWLVSPSGQYGLVYQYDGNLVLYRSDGTPLWGSATVGTSPGAALMQLDGNFVIYTDGSVPVWASMTSFGHPGAHLSVQDDGNVVIYDVDGTPLWATQTAGW